ncbi:alpha/beta fold hydrolase [Pseudomonas sp. D47]|uniref:alpha/beta fold hydrolase n=1 Tax=Pseudomonas sp. D47 TaxID=3159447 RepID=UPI00387AB711
MESRRGPVASAQTWLAGIAHARLEILEGVGHLPMVEATARTTAHCRKLLDKAKVYALICP